MGKFILDNKTMDETCEEINNILAKWSPSIFFLNAHHLFA